MKESLSGLGVWIWQLGKCEGGSLQAILEKAKAAGVSWLAVKAGETHSNGQVSPELVSAVNDAGITPVAWWFCYPRAVNAVQVNMLRDLRERCGVEHFICDAEEDWELDDTYRSTGKAVPQDRRIEAAGLAQSIRDAVGPDSFLADAPWPICTAHPTWPWQEFGSVMDMRMDQLYWEAAKADEQSWSSRADAAWAKFPPVLGDLRCPVGSNVSATGVGHGPPSALKSFLEHYGMKPAISVWSWQHLSAEEWDVISQFTASLKGCGT